MPSGSLISKPQDTLASQSARFIGTQSRRELSAEKLEIVSNIVVRLSIGSKKNRSVPLAAHGLGV